MLHRLQVNRKSGQTVQIRKYADFPACECRPDWCLITVVSIYTGYIVVRHKQANYIVERSKPQTWQVTGTEFKLAYKEKRGSAAVIVIEAPGCIGLQRDDWKGGLVEGYEDERVQTAE